MSRPRFHCRFGIHLLTGIALVCTSLAVGDDAPSAPIKFRRVYAPADRPADWPKGDQVYKPVDAELFDRIVDSNAGTAADAIANAQIRRAIYTAQLKGEDLLVGEATYDIQALSDDPVMMPLAPCGIALEDVAWNRKGQQHSARVGINRDSRLVVLVRGSGQLHCTWTARGRRDATGQMQFFLQLPSSVAKRFELQLPESFRPDLDDGLVTPIGDADMGHRSWNIELGGRSKIQLRVARNDPASLEPRLNLVRQALTYDFSMRGLQLDAELTLSVFQDPLKQLSIFMDPQLQLIEARMGEREISWATKSGRDDGRLQAVLHFERPIVGADRVLRLRALAPLATNKLWQLPKIELQGLFWQEGTATLLVAAPMSLAELQLENCRQSQVGTLPGRTSGEAIELEYHGPQASASVVLTEGRSSVMVESATTLTLDDHLISGRMVCDVTVSGPQRFDLLGIVAGDWRIESVISEPPDTVDWKATDSGRAISIQSKHGISTEQPLRLIITGRNRHSPLGRAVNGSELTMFRFQDVQTARHLLHVVARDPFHVRATGLDALRQLDPLALPAADHGRLTESPADELTGMLWLDDRGHNRYAVTLAQQSPRFVAEIDVTATADAESLQHTCHIHCAPQDSVVDRINVRYAHHQEEDPQWSVFDVSGEALDGVRATRVPAVSEAIGSDGEIWTVTWNQPQSEPFRVVVERTSPLLASGAVNLASVPGAAEQLGTVAVAGKNGADITVNNRTLKPLPAAQIAKGQYSPVAARFRYDPDQHVVDAQVVPLSLSVRPPGTKASGAVVWSAFSESWFSADGSAKHRFVYYLENDGRRNFAVRFKPGTHLGSATVDGVPVRQTGSEISRRAAVVLPENQRFVVVELSLQTTTTGVRWRGWYDRTALPDPQLAIPVLGWRRILHAPPGMVVHGEGPSADGPGQLSWRNRLFGPLGRDESISAFDPFSLASWRASAGWRTSQRRKQRIVADDFLATFGAMLQGHPEGLRFNALSHIDANETGEDPSSNDVPPLFIDRRAMILAGITPETEIVVVGSGSASDVAAETLMRANLIVVAEAGSAWLTTADALVVPDDAWFIEGVACHGTSGPSDSRIGGEIPAAHPLRETVPIKAWSNSATTTASPWAVTQRDGYILTDNKGWTTTYIDADAGGEHTVYVINTAVLDTLRWTLFLLFSVGAYLWLPKQRAIQFVSVAILATLALVLDATIAPLVTSALLGMFVALICRNVPWSRIMLLVGIGDGQPSMARQSRFHDTTLDATRALSVPEALLLLVISAGLLSVLSGDGLAEDLPLEDGGPPVHRVFVPVDSENKPVSDTYYVPEPLFDALHQHAALQHGAPSGWLITSANYRGQLEWAPDHGRLVTANLTASYAIEVFGRNALVRIPLSAHSVGDERPTVSLDGNPVQPVEATAAGPVVIQISEPGIYNVEIAFRPTTDVVGATRRMDIAIPALATSRLELDIPVDAPDIAVDSAIGGVVREDVSGRVSAQLGATNRLTASWRDAGAAGAAMVDDVDQLLWLNIQPGAVVVDARLRINVKDRRIRQLRLAADPELRLLPPIRATVADKPVGLSHVRTIPGDPVTIELEFDQSVTGIQEIRLPFLLTDITSVGNVRLPYLQLLGARTSRHWVAVSLDPSLRIDRNSVPQNDALTAVATSAVSSPWELGEKQPALYYRQSRLNIDWSFSAQPQESETIGLQRVSLSCAVGHVDTLLDVDLNTTAGYRFQYYVRVPKGFITEQATLIADGIQRVARWTTTPDERTSDDRLTIFLNGPATGRQQLSVRGRFPATTGVVEVPRFQLDGVSQRGSQLALYRQPSVRVELESAAGLQPAGDVLPSIVPPEFGRSVGVYTRFAGDAVTRVLVERNDTDVSAVQSTSIDRVDGQWNAIIDLQLAVSGGVLDELRLRVSPEFKGPFQLEPQTPHRLTGLASDEFNVLIIRPSEAIAGNYRLRLSGPLTMPSGDLVSPPDVRAGDISKVTRYVALPKQVESQHVAWKTFGLIRRPLPDALRQPELNEGAFDSYLVAGAVHGAALQSVDQRRIAAKIHLADIEIRGRGDGNCVGRAVFDLEPSGLAKIHVQLPGQNSTLLHARVGGLTAVPALVDGKWELPLASENLPQRIEIIYGATFPHASGHKWPVGAPQLLSAAGPIDVQETLWTIASPEIIGSDESGQSDPMDEVESIQRYKRIGRVLDLVSDVTSAEPVDVLAPWYRRWIGRLREARWRLASSVSSYQDQQANDWSRRITDLDQRYQQLANQLIAQGVFSSREDFEAGVDSTSSAWQWSAPTTGSIYRDVLPGQHSEVGVLCRQSQDRDLVVRICLVLAFVSVSSLILGKGWLPASSLSRYVSPLPVAFVAAVFYWLFLTPSILGLMAVFLIAVLALRVGRAPRRIAH